MQRCTSSCTCVGPGSLTLQIWAAESAKHRPSTVAAVQVVMPDEDAPVQLGGKYATQGRNE